MWRTLQHWMQTAGLGTAPRKLLGEMAEVRSLDVVLPTRAGTELRLHTVSRPEQHLAILLQRPGLPLPGRPKNIDDVVATIPLINHIAEQLEKSRLCTAENELRTPSQSDLGSYFPSCRGR